MGEELEVIQEKIEVTLMGRAGKSFRGAGQGGH